MNKLTQNPLRFQITLVCNMRQVSHVCAAQTEVEAVERVMRSYPNTDPKLLNVRHLGILPKPRRNTRKPNPQNGADLGWG